KNLEASVFRSSTLVEAKGNPMKSFPLAALGFTAAIGLSRLALAHDGHNHGSYGTPSGASRQVYGFSRDASFGSGTSCSPRGCPCSANNTSDTLQGNSSIPVPASQPPKTIRPITKLDAGLNRLGNDLRYETRGSRGQAVLMEDYSRLRNDAQRLEQSVERRADGNHLREEAARVKRSLIQLDTDMRREGRFPESERSLVEVAGVFAAMVDDLGLTRRAPSYQSAPPAAPTYAPRGNGITPPIGTPRPLIQPNPSRQPLTQRIPKGMEGIAKLSPADQASALAQQMCPVTNQKLGSMGKPIRVTVSGRSLWVCCQGCVDAVQSNPSQYFRGL
ncbi:MAG: hypothetical protein KDA84_04865, partial [Planctomycetaceae bacterium]|nr:hypothetical protein [Planctomycetaceae bacterium]